jgi:hypothetical protein
MGIEYRTVYKSVRFEEKSDRYGWLCYSVKTDLPMGEVVYKWEHFGFAVAEKIVLLPFFMKEISDFLWQLEELKKAGKILECYNTAPRSCKNCNNLHYDKYEDAYGVQNSEAQCSEADYSEIGNLNNVCIHYIRGKKRVEEKV